jgi:hypothetical protein
VAQAMEGNKNVHSITITCSRVQVERSIGEKKAHCKGSSTERHSTAWLFRKAHRYIGRHRKYNRKVQKSRRQVFQVTHL